jgi:eukaryotic-like serine/threonine-protein kinase
MPAPTQLIESLADRYRVERELGMGGMATVYLAHDLRHDRKVALKVLRPELSAILGADRFLAEIKTTANLQHPHILPLHDSGEAGGMVFYVMPFIEGQSLRDRLNQEKQLPVEEAVRIGREVAEALDYAHRHGVIHRDIKPENILLHDGRALVADFGIALAVSRTDGSNRMTETGMSLGTPFYMSPEQAMGERDITARSDIYALGCVIYEMLTGEPPFTGPSAQAIIARVMTEQPRSLTLQRHTVPPHVEAAVGMALEKLPADRFATAAQFAEALARPGFVTRPMGAVTGVGAGHLTPWKTIGVFVAPALLVGLGLGWLSRRPPAAPAMRFEVTLDKIRPDAGMDLSPDGSTLAFAATDSTGPNHLYIRRLDRLEAQLIPAAGTTVNPVFSPDGQQIVYLDPPTSIRRISLLGTPPVLLTDSAAFAGLDWGRDGWIYYVDLHNTLARIPAAGGRPEILLAPDTVGVPPALFGPSALPNGKGVLLATSPAGGGLQVQVMDLATHRLKLLVQGFRPRYAAPGRLLYATPDGSLFAAPFDQDRMVITGPAELVGTSLYSPIPGWVDFAASRTGILTYLSVAGPHVSGLNIVTVDRAGRDQLLPIPPANFDVLALSPDGRRVAAEVIHGADDGGDIVTFGLGDSVVTRLTFRGLNRYPAWTPDGRRVAFSQFLDGERDLVWKPADGSGQEETLLKRPGPQFEVEFSRDGRWMIYREGDANGGARGLGLRYRSLTPGGIDSVFYDGSGSDITPALSPDGRWLAYASDESGHSQIYVRPFPPQSSGAVWQVSTTEGTEPVWSRSGGELFYKEGGWLMAAAVKTSPSFSVVARRRLFQIARYNSNPYRQRYAVLPGDQRFLMDRAVETNSPAQPVVVLNWVAGLGKK